MHPVITALGSLIMVALTVGAAMDGAIIPAICGGLMALIFAFCALVFSGGREWYDD